MSGDLQFPNFGNVQNSGIASVLLIKNRDVYVLERIPDTEVEGVAVFL